MPTDTIAIQIGMTVKDTHGEEIGCVAKVWPYMAASYADGPPTPGQKRDDPADVGFFSIDRGGILGVGATHLYVPFKAVHSVGPGGSITLGCTAQECGDTYSEQPWFVHRDAG